MNLLAQGQSLEAQGRFTEALAAYDRALAAAADDARQRGLAWMNRGNVLQKLAACATHEAARREFSRAAVQAYETALASLAELPPHEPAVRNHRGAAWLNRGHALIAAGQMQAAIESLEKARDQFAQLPLEEDAHFRLNLAGALCNLAHACIEHAPERARVEARAALEVLQPVERAHEAFAAMSLRARRALVVAAGEILQAPAPDPDRSRARAEEAIDTVEAGLALARELIDQGASTLLPLAARLFRLGGQLYRLHQPHFLAEFLLEHLRHEAFARAEFRLAAAEAVEEALSALRRPQLFVVGTPAAERLASAYRALLAAQQQLSAYHPSPLANAS